jgi:hypothetical protein
MDADALVWWIERLIEYETKKAEAIERARNG